MKAVNQQVLLLIYLFKNIWMQARTNKDIEAIFWLTVNMAINRTYVINESQQQIIKYIFTVSGIGLPVEPTKGYDYYFDIPDDYSTIKKVKI